MCSIRNVPHGYHVRLRADIPPVFVSVRAVAISIIEQHWFMVCAP